MPRQRVERLVVERRHHFGGHQITRITGRLDLRPPDLLRRRLDPPREPLPSDRQLLVGPGHVDRQRLEVEPAVADQPCPHGESAAVLRADLHGDWPLRPPWLSPEP